MVVKKQFQIPELMLLLDTRLAWELKEKIQASKWLSIWGLDD